MTLHPGTRYFIAICFVGIGFLLPLPFQAGEVLIGGLFVWLAVKAEELYAFFIDLRLPLPFIYVIFQTVFLIPRFGERAGDILTAQQARGFILKGLRNRARALLLIFPPLFASMLYELEETAASLSARGLHAPGGKSHLCHIGFGPFDLLIIIGSILFTSVLFFTVGS